MQKQNHNLDPERIVDFERFRSRILERIVKNVPLLELLGEIVAGIERLNPTLLCSIVLIKDNQIKLGAANSLPKSFNEAIEGITIGPKVGSCGTAAYTGKRVIVEDINTSPLWQEYKEIALREGLLSCWSEPIFSHMETVIGTFAMYQKKIASPTDYDIFLISETAGLVSIAIERNIAEEKVKSLLLEKEMILREVHHRIKNNMAILNNLLEQQARSHANEEVRNSLHEATSRIKTMSVLYDKLYMGRTIEEIPLNEYLEPLVKEIISLFPYPVQLSLDVIPIKLSSEQLQAIGIITNELLTNSLKYGREETKDLKIQIKVWKENLYFFLLISDNGTGFTLDVKDSENFGFGLNLVRMLAKQIKADLVFHGENGAEYQFKIPIQTLT